MTRSRFLLLLTLSVASSLQAQSKIRPTDDDMPASKLAAIPNFVLDARYKDRVAHPLPASVDNSKKPFMTPVDQWNDAQGMSCGNATAVSFTYAYSALALQNIPTDPKVPSYTYEYTYHFLNANDMDNGDAWRYVEAYDILKETGAPTTADFGGIEWGNAFGGWMTGYDKYYKAMKLRVDEYYKIDAKLAANDELIKQYLYDQGDGSASGGLLAIQVGEWTMKTVSGKNLVTDFDGFGHTIAIVGYDDNFQGGSYLMADNMGDRYIWAPYKLFRTGGNVAIESGSWPMFPRIKKNYSPKLTFKITLTHDQRDKIAIMTGYANSATAAAPAKLKDYAGAFNFAGGSVPMVGKNRSATIEIGLDLTDFVPFLTGKEARFFLHVISKGGTGRIDKVSLMDYTTGEVKEIPGAETNKPIAANGITEISIPWSGVTAAIGLTPSSRVRQAGRASDATLNLRDVKGRVKTPRQAAFGDALFYFR
jgi:hypothetical protein